MALSAFSLVSRSLFAVDISDRDASRAPAHTRMHIHTHAFATASRAGQRGGRKRTRASMRVCALVPCSFRRTMTAVLLDSLMWLSIADVRAGRPARPWADPAAPSGGRETQARWGFVRPLLCVLMDTPRALTWNRVPCAYAPATSAFRVASSACEYSVFISIVFSWILLTSILISLTCRPPWRRGRGGVGATGVSPGRRRQRARSPRAGSRARASCGMPV